MTDYTQTQLGIENTLRSRVKVRQLTPEQLGIPDNQRPTHSDDDRWEALREAASDVKDDSTFAAAVQTEDGSILTGKPLSEGASQNVHALELAIWKGYEQNHSPILQVAVATNESTDKPCGRCLQVLRDYSGGKGTEIQVFSGSEVEQYALDELLP